MKLLKACKRHNNTIESNFGYTMAIHWKKYVKSKPPEWMIVR